MSRSVQLFSYGPDVMPDTGCDVSSSCLSCPLPLCKHDAPRGQTARIKNAPRNLLIAEAYHSGEDTGLIASRFNITSRSIFRIAREVRNSA